MESWNEMTDKDRTRLLLEKAMGYFILEETATGFHTPEFAKDKPVPVGFHWPIAFWNTDGECWVYRDIGDNNITFFDPLHDLNDAWKIIEKLQSTGDIEQIKVYWLSGENNPHVDFTFHPIASSRINLHLSGSTLQMAICVATSQFITRQMQEVNGGRRETRAAKHAHIW